MAETRIVQDAAPHSAWLPLPELLTSDRIIPNDTKSQTSATRVTMKVSSENSDASRPPTIPAPSAKRNEMNASPVAIGCKIITRVKPLDVSAA